MSAESRQPSVTRPGATHGNASLCGLWQRWRARASRPGRRGADRPRFDFSHFAAISDDRSATSNASSTAGTGTRRSTRRRATDEAIAAGRWPSSAIKLRRQRASSDRGPVSNCAVAQCARRAISTVVITGNPRRVGRRCIEALTERAVAYLQERVAAGPRVERRACRSRRPRRRSPGCRPRLRPARENDQLKMKLARRRPPAGDEDDLRPPACKFVARRERSRRPLRGLSTRCAIASSAGGVLAAEATAGRSCWSRSLDLTDRVAARWSKSRRRSSRRGGGQRFRGRWEGRQDRRIARAHREPRQRRMSPAAP